MGELSANPGEPLFFLHLLISMAKDPAFTWYAQDFIVDTIQWTRAMQGLHSYLLSVAWINRGLTPDGTGAPTGLTPDDLLIWCQIKAKWKLRDGVLVNDRLEETREKRRKFTESQSIKGKKAHLKKISATPVEPFVSVNEIVIEIENKLNSALDEIYLDAQKPKWNHIDFDFELTAFMEKVRGSPTHYAGHDTGGMRLAFQAQLRNAKPIKNGRPNGKTPAFDIDQKFNK